ncbi:MAG: CDP-alcohol phosphatidyltransferase family protein [Aquificaceae bacterium]
MNLTSRRESLKKFYLAPAFLFFKLGVHPNFITLLSLGSGIISALFFYFREPVFGSFFLLLCGIFDLSDGELARLSSKTSGFGAILDWCVDKVVDIFVLGCIGLSYSHDFVALGAICSSTIHSFLKPLSHSEISASLKERLESVGFFGRPETHILIILCGILEGFKLFSALEAGIFLVFLFSSLSLSQRIFYILRHS